jgi:hypothetical protein
MLSPPTQGPELDNFDCAFSPTLWPGPPPLQRAMNTCSAACPRCHSLKARSIVPTLPSRCQLGGPDRVLLWQDCQHCVRDPVQFACLTGEMGQSHKNRYTRNVATNAWREGKTLSSRARTASWRSRHARETAVVDI